MPVMLTGVEGAIGAAAVRLLAGRASEVRAFVQVDGPDGGEGLATRLRALGCKVAHGDLDDEAHVETALEQVHTVLHLLGRPTDDADAYLDRTATVVGAATGAGCRRLVLLSDLAVAATTGPRTGGVAPNPWLEALEAAEDLVADAPMEGVVLRCALVHGPDDPLTTAVAAGALGEDPPGAHWPVAAGDVAAAAVLADAERDLDVGLHVVVGVAGPDRVTTADYARALARLVPGAAAGAPLPAQAVDLLHREVERPEGAVGSAGTSLPGAWTSSGRAS